MPSGQFSWATAPLITWIFSGAPSSRELSMGTPPPAPPRLRSDTPLPRRRAVRPPRVVRPLSAGPRSPPPSSRCRRAAGTWRRGRRYVRHHHRRRSIVLRRGHPDGGLAGAGIAVQSVGQVHDLILIFDAGPVLFRQPGHSPSQGLGHLPQQGSITCPFSW